MNKKLNSNRGFTLIELIIAIAVLAFLMTAISSLMTSSLITNRKTQADIEVQTTAQETYNKITDALMQAKSVYILGYTYPGTPDFSK
ncbi:MAG: prepilin-type N-terminal cleavage/methylation domain-containing protein, partial [Ruminococcus sp.]|nr:prepilin-type N-terminal cleavage/methylation domain-containing protein [Ruminococcus sp.]